MSRNRAPILLTGFGPFPGVTENASAELVERLALAARRRFPKRRIQSHILPTEWIAAPRKLAELHAGETPRLILHFGVSERATGFVIETRGHNARKSAADASGALPPSRCIWESAPDLLPVTLPAERILARLRDLKLPADLSDDAGGYLCNAILFQSLCLAGEAKTPPPTGFIHIPARIPGRRLDWEQATTGGLEIIRTCLGLADRPRRL